MTIGATVLKPSGTPFPTIALGVLTAFFVIQAFIVSGWMTVLSLVVALIFAAAAAWVWWRSRRSAVLINPDDFTVANGTSQRTYARSDVVAVDLSAPHGQVSLADGRRVTLPLEGRDLIEAGLLLTPQTDLP
jgi:membrane protein implicated in regulation of membrane protease activity